MKISFNGEHLSKLMMSLALRIDVRQMNFSKTCYFHDNSRMNCLN